MRTIGLFAVIAVVLVKVKCDDAPNAPGNHQTTATDHTYTKDARPSVARTKRNSAVYSPHVYFPGYYYSNAQPWLHPQYERSDTIAAVRRRRGTTHRPQHYSIWDLSRRKRRSTRSVRTPPLPRVKRQITFYDGGNALSSGYSLADLRRRHPDRSPGIEQSYYHSNNPYSAWDLSRRRRRRRRRRQVLNAFDGNGVVGNDADSSGPDPAGGQQSSDVGDRLPHYTVWDLVRRRKREVMVARSRSSFV